MPSSVSPIPALGATKDSVISAGLPLITAPMSPERSKVVAAVLAGECFEELHN